MIKRSISSRVSWPSFVRNLTINIKISILEYTFFKLNDLEYLASELRTSLNNLVVGPDIVV
jgi:hypothetical protein